MEMTRQRHSESGLAAVYDDCPYCKGRGKVKSALTMSVEIQRKLSEILKKRSRDESDFQLRIVVHPSILERLRTEDEKLLIELEKRYFGKLSFRADPAFHAEQFKIVNVATNEEMASVGGGTDQAARYKAQEKLQFSSLQTSRILDSADIWELERVGSNRPPSAGGRRH